MKRMLILSLILNVLLICLWRSYIIAQKSADAVLRSRMPVEGVLGRPYLCLHGENGYPSWFGWHVTYHLDALTTYDPVIRISLFGNVIYTNIPDIISPTKTGKNL